MHPHGPPPPSHHQPLPSDEERHPVTITSAVAIDKDKNSQHAFKWAVDNLMINSPYIALIHVRHRHVHRHLSKALEEKSTHKAKTTKFPYSSIVSKPLEYHLGALAQA
ncbi:hypothetical protein QJS10_CPB18g00683 [Acorus calamus]|uniref:UspA domain-containing protein n=1 Tax=Acorus calamus TaxID=4465 RepID=A0AAV9CNR1_ACOCL|nr:hypothetical protein QJS10_CPB18g00683 [Acorus calamus]